MLSLNVRDLLPHDATGFGTGTASVCETAGVPFRNGLVTVSFVPMSGPLLADNAATLEVVFELKGPEAPIAQTLTAGNSTLTLGWTTPNSADASE